MIIEIVSDTVCPWCFVGKRRLERALAEQAQPGLQIGWRPFQLNPDMPAGGIDRQEYLSGKFGGAENARRAYDPIHEAGKDEGIPFAFGDIARTPNSVNSHRLIARAAGYERQHAVVEALFEAYFIQGRDVETPESLAVIAGEAGLDEAETLAFLMSDEGTEEVRAEDAMARQLGIQGVPCFIIDRKYAISGAQDPAVFHKAFAVAREAEAEGAAGEEAAVEEAAGEEPAGLQE